MPISREGEGIAAAVGCGGVHAKAAVGYRRRCKVEGAPAGIVIVVPVVGRRAVVAFPILLPRLRAVVVDVDVDVSAARGEVGVAIVPREEDTAAVVTVGGDGTMKDADDDYGRYGMMTTCSHRFRHLPTI